MNKEALMEILPHREHMLLLDEAEKQDDEAVGHYTVRGDEFFLMFRHAHQYVLAEGWKKHFPGCFRSQ